MEKVATSGLKRCLEFVTRDDFDADEEPGLSDSEVLEDWLETPPPEAQSTTAGGAGNVDRDRVVGLVVQ